jgi:MFS transporter, OPA family, sugar phosphate sensor protein UhpC
MGFFKIFNTDPAVAEIQETAIVNKKYNYWRLRVFIGMYIGYIFYYFSRRSFICIMPLLIRDLGMSKVHLGLVGSLFAIAYGFSKFVSGVLSDRCSPRVFMSAGLIIAGILNIAFGLSSSLILFTIVWTLTGFFQGWGAPPCAQLLRHWYSQKERGTWWGMWSSSQNIGGALLPIVIAGIANALGWRFGMYGIGFLCVGVGLFTFFCLRDTPTSLGLPVIEKFKNDEYGIFKKEKEKISLKELLFKYILNNGYLWFLGSAYFFIYLVRGGFNNWIAVFLIEKHGYGITAANVSTTWFEIGGLLGTFIAGWASDKLLDGKRGPINVLSSLALAFFVMVFSVVNGLGSIALDYLLVFFIGFFVFGPQMLIGVVAVEICHKKAAGSSNGFIGWIGYLGMAAAGVPLGKIIEFFGWNGFFISMCICACISVFLLIPLWAVRFNTKFVSLEK